MVGNNVDSICLSQGSVTLCTEYPTLVSILHGHFELRLRFQIGGRLKRILTNQSSMRIPYINIMQTKKSDVYACISCWWCSSGLYLDVPGFLG